MNSFATSAVDPDLFALTEIFPFPVEKFWLFYLKYDLKIQEA